MSKKNKEWENLALEAMSIAFDKDGQPKKNIDQTDLKKAIDLFYKSINTLQPDLAWPFLKLADLVHDKKEKIELYLRAYQIEENIYSAAYLFKEIMKKKLDIVNILK